MVEILYTAVAISEKYSISSDLDKSRGKNLYPEDSFSSIIVVR